MRLRRQLLPVVVLALGCGRAPSEAQMIDAEPLRARVQAELLVSDGAPAVDALVRLGSRGDLAALLAEIAADPTEPPLARHRALALIAEFPSPRGQELLSRLKTDAPGAYTRTVAARALERLRQRTAAEP